MDLTRALDVAVEAGRAGAQVAHRSFGKDIGRDLKRDGTWVTQADHDAERAARAVIAGAYGSHNVLGEEGGLLRADGGPPREGAPTWVIDPIDGTNNYIAGIPIWGTLVALRVDGRSVVGACIVPLLHEEYDAAEGHGARFNGSVISVDGSVTSLDAATVLYASAGSFFDAGRGDMFETLVGRARRSRGLGDFWGHVLVARGAAHLMLEPHLSLWDVAALEPIVREAGGRITGWDGHAWRQDLGSCLTTNGALHDEALSLVEPADVDTF